MSDLPIAADYFVGGQRVTPVDSSEGGTPLASLINAAGQSAESETVLGAALDLEAASAAVVAAANRGLTTNIGADRQVTLPDYADAPAGWEHTFISLDAGTNELTIAADTGGTINGVSGDITLTTASHEWVKVMKLAGATGWTAIGGTLVTPA